jgi:hypothetical protein
MVTLQLPFMGTEPVEDQLADTSCGFRVKTEASNTIQSLCAGRMQGKGEARHSLLASPFLTLCLLLVLPESSL